MTSRTFSYVSDPICARMTLMIEFFLLLFCFLFHPL